MFEFVKNRNKKEAFKKAILKEYFNSGNQKKIITQAAKESAKDQNILLTKYRELLHP